MRNSLGALVSVLVGSSILAWMLNIPDPLYTWPYNTFWFITSGSDALRQSMAGILTTTTCLVYILSWILIGLILGLFSKKGWNTFRSIVWTAIVLGIFSLASILLATPEYWTSPTRNVDLIFHFINTLMVSLLALPTAVLVATIIDKMKIEVEQPIPDKIETSCECGAVFKSNPLICSECGRQLRES